MASCNFPLAHLLWPLCMKPFVYVTACGEQESTEVWCYFYPICSQNSSPRPAGHRHPLPLPYCLSEWRVGAAEVCRDTWYTARGLYAGSLVHIPQVGSHPAGPSLTLQDILSRPMSLFLCAQPKPRRFQGQIWRGCLFESSVSFSSSNLPWKNAEIPKIKVL